MELGRYGESGRRGRRVGVSVWMKEKVGMLRSVGRLYRWVMVDWLEERRG